jgi:membrane fusion protein, heavy metal efflux system
VAGFALTLTLSLAQTGCGPGAASGKTAAKGEPPVKVTGAPKEAELNIITLSAEAETRLGVVTAEVVKKAVPKTATYAGEVMIATGKLIAVSSPLVGTLKPPPGGMLPIAGASVKEGQAVCTLVPILSPEARATMVAQLIQAEGSVKQAQDQLTIAKVALERVERLVKDNSVSKAAVDDARNQFDLAQTNLRNAVALRDTLKKVGDEAETGSATTLTITAPAAGMIQNVHVQLGQKVAAGAALFQVAEMDPLWVKVPVYVGEYKKLAADRPAEIGGLADAPGAPGARLARPVAAPPMGDPLAATVNVYYELPNKDGAFHPGERVGVILPLNGEAESLTVPRASLLRDFHGGAWVYEKTAEHSYARRRVLVDRVVGDLAVLTAGAIKPGAKVVTDGAAEIYGTEFNGGK